MDPKPHASQTGQKSPAGFTLTELIVVTSVLAILALTVLPALARTQPNAKAALCQNNLRQLTGAWRMYAEDNLQRTINNFGISDTMVEITARKYRNWANNVMSWDADPMNTNKALLKDGILGTYLRRDTGVYKCPADNYVSPVQRSRGYSGRTRSFSMNAFFGPFTPDPNDAWSSGRNTFSSSYLQWLKVTEVRKPDSYFVIIEEHPDSNNDGLFLNDPTATPSQWRDIPGSFHNGAVSLSFADGHAEIHLWKSLTTIVPLRFFYVTPILDAAGLDDYRWLMNRMAVPF
jgi:prepilin-type N-terminal cleavage/methylation domain-containing protein/prepilin-type processing-associated H-X9-DG protein